MLAGARDARRALVPRRHAQLRRARAAPRRRQRPTTSPSSPAARPATPIELTWAELRPTSPPRPPACAASASAPATGSSPTPRTSPRRWSPSSPRRRSAPSGRAARRSSACARSSTASPRSSRPCSSPSTATATAPRTSTGPPRSPRSSPPCRRCATSCTCRTSRPRPAAGRRRRGPSCSPAATGAPTFEAVAADHPLYVLFSSGTTGLPKAIVHGHGGIVAEHLKVLALHQDLGPGDRFCWFTTTGWMMWNYLVSGLLDRGDDRAVRRRPGGAVARRRCGTSPPTPGVTVFGVSAPFLMACRKAGLTPRPGRAPLGRLDRRAAAGRRLPLGARRASACPCRRSAAAPTCARRSSARRRWCRCGPARSAAACSAAPSRRSRPTAQRVPAGRDRRAGRHRADAVDAGRLLGRRRRQPLPGRLLRGLPRRVAPRRLGHVHRRRRLRDHRALRRHAQPRRRAARHERLLRRGRGASPRSPTASSCTSRTPTAAGWAGCCCSSPSPPAPTLDDDLPAGIRAALRAELSPRHVPDAIEAVPVVPRTLSGKKLEVPVKRILTGTPAARRPPPRDVARRPDRPRLVRGRRGRACR